MVIRFIVILAIIGLAIYIVIIFNNLISLKNNITKSWSNIDVLLKQRSDELPNLINTVKGYMMHEREVLLQLTKARSELLKAKTIGEKASADSMISGTLKTIFAIAENYPTLRANDNFSQLQVRITGLENEIADRREFYNDSVTTYNIRIQSIPDIIIAKILKMEEETLFKVDEVEKENVNVGL